MKTSTKIFLLVVAMALLTGCSTERRASRMVRRAVSLCPELVQMKAHPIDTVLTAPAYTTMAIVPVAEVFTGETVYAATQHGTFVVSVSQSDSSLRVGFVAAPHKVHYQDTIRYPQVIVPETLQSRASGFWNSFLWWLAGVGFSLALCVWVLGNILKNNRK